MGTLYRGESQMASAVRPEKVQGCAQESPSLSWSLVGGTYFPGPSLGTARGSGQPMMLTQPGAQGSFWLLVLWTWPDLGLHVLAWPKDPHQFWGG